MKMIAKLLTYVVLTAILTILLLLPLVLHGDLRISAIVMAYQMRIPSAVISFCAIVVGLILRDQTLTAVAACIFGSSLLQCFTE